MAWWQRQAAGPLGGFGWWLQVGLVALFALAPTILTLAYLRIIDAIAIGLLVLVAALVGAIVVFSRRGDKSRAFASLASCALAGVVMLTLVAFPHVGSMKDMSPFLLQIKQRLPADQPVYVTGRIDETLRGIVPFVLDRKMIELELPELYELQPQCVIVQDKNAGETAPRIESSYRMIRERDYGPGRYLAFWCRSDIN
jgi:hypothetical protein